MTIVTDAIQAFHSIQPNAASMTCLTIRPQPPIENTGPSMLQDAQHVDDVLVDREDVANACKPDHKIEKTFSLLVHNWNKKNLDRTFIIGTPEYRHKQIWIKNGNLKQAFSKKNDRNRHY